MSSSSLKSLAKTSLSGNFGVAIFAMIIAGVIAGIPSTMASQLTQGEANYTVVLIVDALAFFVLPIQIGYNRVHMDISELGSSEIEKVFSGFTGGVYLKNVLALFLMAVFTILWTLLLIIPGIIKSFAYAMTPFILADPEYKHLSATEAITKSREMMDGNKLNYFILGLSFILWIILIVITCGIASFYVIPYMQQTMAEFYFDVKGVSPSTNSLHSDDFSTGLEYNE